MGNIGNFVSGIFFIFICIIFIVPAIGEATESDTTFGITILIILAFIAIVSALIGLISYSVIK